MNLKQLFQPEGLTRLNLSPPDEAKYGDWSTPATGRSFSLINFPLPSSRFLRTDLTAQEAVAHELVFRCLQKISDALMDAQPIVEQARRNGAWEAVDHPLIARLKKPNDEQGWAEFITSLAIDEQVWGRWYFEIIRSRSNGVTGFVPLDVRAVTEIGERGESWGLSEFWDAGLATGKVVGYRITEATETRVIDLENIVAFYLFDRRSPLAGLSPVRVALNAAGVDVSLNRYADTYLSKGGPAGLLRIKNKKLSPTDAQAIQERWYESYKAGGSREGRIAVLDEDGEFQAIGGHLGDIGNDVLKQHAQAAICGALGVPPILAGAFVGLRWSNQRAGVAGAHQDLWANKISPTLARYRSVFDARVLSLYEDPALIGSRLRTNWDLSQVAALIEDVDILADRVRKDRQAGIISLNEARTARGYPPIEGGDDLLPDPEDEDEPEDDQDPKANNQSARLFLRALKAKHDYSSTQVNLPSAIASEIIKAGKLIPDSDLAEAGRETKPHITVKYGLHTADPADLESILEDVQPIKATFGKTAIFEGEEFDVVYVSITSPDLRALNKAISDALPHTDTHPGYTPHATIAYVKPGRGQAYKGQDFLEGVSTVFDELVFSSKTGKTTVFKLGKKKDHQHAHETKSYDFNGLKLARKPTDTEARIIATIAQAQERAYQNLKIVLAAAQVDLIDQAAERAAKLSKPHLLTLTLEPERRKGIAQEVGIALQLGRKSVLIELNQQSGKREADEEETASIVERIVESVGAGIVTAVGSRFVSDLLRRLLRGLDKQEAVRQTRAELEQGSVSYVEEIAQGGASQAIADGRRIEARRQQRDGDRFIYSALLDVNTCAPCKAVDLSESTNIDGLPQAPNPDCEGRWRCRCQIVIARD